MRCGWEEPRLGKERAAAVASRAVMQRGRDRQAGPSGRRARVAGRDDTLSSLSRTAETATRSAIAANYREAWRCASRASGNDGVGQDHHSRLGSDCWRWSRQLLPTFRHHGGPDRRDRSPSTGNSEPTDPGPYERRRRQRGLHRACRAPGGTSRPVADLARWRRPCTASRNSSFCLSWVERASSSPIWRITLFRSSSSGLE